MASEMHFIYGLAEDNALQVRRLYIKRNVLARKIFVIIKLCLLETGMLKWSGGPETSLIARTECGGYDGRRFCQFYAKKCKYFNISPWTVYEILKSNFLYPYHITTRSGTTTTSYDLMSMDFADVSRNPSIPDTDFFY